MREILTIIALIFWVVWSVKVAGAHEWYPRTCCHGNDCAEITVGPIMLPDGSWQATTKHGTMVFDPDTIIRPSKDMNNHACINFHVQIKPGLFKGRCLFFGGGA